MTGERARPPSAHLRLVPAAEDGADATGRPRPSTEPGRPSAPGGSAAVTLSAGRSVHGRLGITEDEVLIRQRRGALPDPITAADLAEHGGSDLGVRR
ncbi:hypothetical protein Ae707Ps1_6117 [Pseudonocardia sp. Ae707_Ps1]|nr:hypothetical protein Ae707Ps1_6117 [Pseudonocardia sp. Ae707_Ps1]